MKQLEDRSSMKSSVLDKASPDQKTLKANSIKKAHAFSLEGDKNDKKSSNMKISLELLSQMHFEDFNSAGDEKVTFDPNALLRKKDHDHSQSNYMKRTGSVNDLYS